MNLFLSKPELAVLRVAERVQKGGHNIPEDIIRRRYVAGINNLFRLFIPRVDYWDIYDNSMNPRVQIACGGKNANTNIFEESLFNQIKKHVK